MARGRVIHRPDGIGPSDAKFTLFLYSVWSGRVARTTVRTTMGLLSSGSMIEMPNIGFYTSMPPDAKCVFSIAGREDKRLRHLDHPLPERPTEAWSDSRIQCAANKFRAGCPEAAGALVRPTEWEHLFDYFDACDLWYCGAWNLWAVIRRLCDENDATNAKGPYNPSTPIVVDNWVYCWLTYPVNRATLSRWSRLTDILNILSDEDWRDLGPCRPDTLDMVRSNLLRWYVYYNDADRPKNPQSQQISKEDKTGKNDKHAACKQTQFAAQDLEPSETAVNTGGARLFVTASSWQRPASVPSSAVPSLDTHKIRAIPVDISNPILGHPWEDNFENESDFENVETDQRSIVASDISAQEVTTKQGESSKNSEAQSTRQAPQKPSASVTVTMTQKTDAIVQKHKKAGKKGKELALQVVEAQKQAPQDSQHLQSADCPPAQSSDSTNSQPQFVSVHHNAGPSAARQQPITRKPQRPKTGSGSTNGSSQRYHSDALNKPVDSLPGPVVQDEGGDARRMYNSSGPNGNSGALRPYHFRVPSGCLNYDKAGVPNESYRECDCSRCTLKSRSIYVRTTRADQSVEGKLQTLSELFGPFGVIERISPAGVFASKGRYFVVFESEESAVLACKALDGTDCGTTGRPMRVTHPFFSKYYVPFKQAHDRPWQAMGSKPRRRSDDSMHTQRSGPVEHLNVPGFVKGREYIPSPRPIDEENTKEPHGIPHPLNQRSDGSQPPQNHTAVVRHLAANPNAANAKPNTCPPAHLSVSKIYHSNGSPLNVVSRVPSDPFVVDNSRVASQPPPGNITLRQQQPFYHSTRHIPAPRMMGSMERPNQPMSISMPLPQQPEVPPLTMEQITHYTGHQIPIPQPFYQTGIPPLHASPHMHYQGQGMYHPGQHVHQPGYPAPVLGPGPYMFNPYAQPEGQGAGATNSCFPFTQDFSHMPPMPPSAPVWYNPAQPSYGPWAMPILMQANQVHHHHGSSPGVTQDMNASHEPMSFPPPSQYQEPIQTKPPADQDLSHKATTQEGCDNSIRVRLPSTPPETAAESANQGLEAVPQHHTSEPNEAGDSVCHTFDSPQQDQPMSSNEAPVSLDTATVEQHDGEELTINDDEVPIASEEALVAAAENTAVAIEDNPISEGMSDKSAASGDKIGDLAVTVVPDSPHQIPKFAESTSKDLSTASSNSPSHGRSRFVSQDIRLEPGFAEESGTVIRHKPRQYNRLPSSWAPHDNTAYDQSLGLEEYHGSTAGPSDYAVQTPMADYHAPVPYGYAGYTSPPQPPPMASSTEIHNFLYAGVFPPHTGVVCDYQNGEGDKPIGKVKQKKKTKTKKKKGGGSRPQTPPLPVWGGANIPKHDDVSQTQGDRIGGTTCDEVGDTNAADVACAIADERKKKGKHNKPKKTLQLAQGSTEPSGVPGPADSNNPIDTTQPQQETQPQQILGGSSGSNLQNTLKQGVEAKMSTLRVSKKGRGKGGIPHLEALFIPESDTVKTADSHTGITAQVEKALSKQDETNPHGRFKTLPKTFDPWPRQPSLQPSSPVPVTPCDDLNTGFNSQRPSGASMAHSHRTSESYFTAASRLSSRENSPPCGNEVALVAETETRLEWQASPPNTPPKALPTSYACASASTPSTITLNGNSSPSPKAATQIQSPGSRVAAKEMNDRTSPPPMAEAEAPQLSRSLIATTEVPAALIDETPATVACEENADGVQSKPGKGKKKGKKKHGTQNQA